MTTLAVDRVRARSDAYRSLAVLFCDPDLPTWHAEGVGSRLRDSVALAFPQVAADAQAVDAALGDAVDLDLRRDHACLFVGPGRLEAPPYGSVYLDPDRRLMGPSTMRVIEAYAAAGLRIDNDTYDAPDHIAIELEFLQFLDWKSSESKSEEEERRWTAQRREFLGDLVITWVPALAAAIHATASGPFYRALASCLESVITTDVESGA